MQKKYDALTEEEKQKFRTYHIYMRNYLIVLTWYIIFLASIFILACIDLIFHPTSIFTIVWIPAIIYISILLIQRLLEVKKTATLIFGSDDIEQELFGITKEDTKIGLREMLHLFKEIQRGDEI